MRARPETGPGHRQLRAGWACLSLPRVLWGPMVSFAGHLPLDGINGVPACGFGGPAHSPPTPWKVWVLMWTGGSLGVLAPAPCGQPAPPHHSHSLLGSARARLQVHFWFCNGASMSSSRRWVQSLFWAGPWGEVRHFRAAALDSAGTQWSPLPSPSTGSWPSVPCSGDWHLVLEAVPEVGHERVVLLPALVDALDQLLGPLLQDVDARVQRGEVGTRLPLQCGWWAAGTGGGNRRARDLTSESTGDQHQDGPRPGEIRRGGVRPGPAQGRRDQDRPHPGEEGSGWAPPRGGYGR